MKYKKREKKNAARDAQIVALFPQLKSTRLVADTVGVTTKIVNHVLKAHGLSSPREGRIHNPYSACERNKELVLKMCEDGEPLAEIARTVGTKGSEVKKFLRRNGVTKEWPSYLEGTRHYAWKGRIVDKDGYILIHQKGHPNARKHTHYIFEHRLVIEEYLGRTLLPTEVIHHINGVKDDNRIENLQLFQSNGEHLAVDLKGRCPNWSEEGKAVLQETIHRIARNRRQENLEKALL